MATKTGQNIGLINNFAAGDNGWDDELNYMLRWIDTLAQGNVKSMTTTAPPGSPAEGDTYIVPSGASGAWSGNTNKLARWWSGNATPQWEFLTPRAGWMVWVVDLSNFYTYGGSSWSLFSGGGSSSIAINTQTGTTYTLVLGDKGGCVEVNNASSNVVTVPPHSSVAFGVGDNLIIRQMGAGQTSVAAGAGVTLRNSQSLICRAQYSQITLHQRATDEWVVGGDMA